MNKKHLLCLFSGCVLFLLLYSPLRLYFLSDDFDSLLFVQHPQNIIHSFRPLSDASIYLDFQLWKTYAAGFHITNLVLHFLSVFCFYFFAKSLFSFNVNIESDGNSALAAALLFLFYPFHSEAVFWIVGRGSILCTVFGLLSLQCYLLRDKKAAFYFLSLLFFIVALLSYEEAWIVPFLIVVFESVFRKKDSRFSILSVGGFIMVFVLYLAGRYYFTSAIVGTPYGSERMMTYDFFLLGKNFVALIFRSVILPLQSSLLFSICCLLAMLIFAVAVFLVRKKINVVFGVNAACFLLCLLPVVPLGIDTHDTESERFLYLPSVFFILLITQLFQLAIANKKTWVFSVAIVLEAALLWQSYRSFAAASTVCQTTVAKLATLGAADTIFCYRLPGQYQGAFIFRNGFESAVNLFMPVAPNAVFIVSRSELYHPAAVYKAVFFDKIDGNDTLRLSTRSNLKILWKEDEVVFSK